jgi:hypothetical protein
MKMKLAVTFRFNQSVKSTEKNVPVGLSNAIHRMLKA